MKYIGLISSFVAGAILCFCIINYLNFSNNKYDYVVLQKDYKIGNIGYLKSGSILRVDESYPEGFTRYILYLNMSQVEKTQKKNQ